MFKLNALSRLSTGHGITALAAAAIAVLAAGALYGQTTTGINGTVADISGGVISKAQVVATNTATGVASSAVTSSAGTFTIVGLIPGTYSVVAESSGFKRARQRVTVDISRMSTITFKLVVGSTQTTVEVKASALSLETSSPAIGTTFAPELVKTAPIEINSLVRQIDSFMYLAPGVQGNSGSHNINGGVNYENETLFNGVPIAFVDYAGNQTYINPPYESVSEFRVDTSTFNAQYGLGQGAVTYSMASGTNQLHGDAFDILRNQYFDSDGFFPTRFGPNGKPLPPIDQQNNYGFTVGGPIILPKIYNGKNRTFFHFSLDFFKQNLAENQIGTVPTAAMKSGNFSNFVDASGTQIPIYDPLTGKQFPGNIIPPSRISALAKSILPLIPDPDRPGLVFGLESNKLPAVPSISITQHVWDVTLDHKITSSQSIHFSEWRNTVSEPSFTSAPIVPLKSELTSGSNNIDRTNMFLVNYVKTIRPDLVATAGADWLGYTTNQTSGSLGTNFPGVVGSTAFPLVNFDGQNAPTNWGVNGPVGLENVGSGLSELLNRRLSLVFTSDWIWTKGINTFHFGGGYRRLYQDILPCDFCAGTFQFSQRTTSIPNTNDPNFGTDGSSFASFLLGDADAGGRIMAVTSYMRSRAFSLYAQDNIQVNKRLTVNAGLRWDIPVPFTESNNNIVYLNPTGSNPGAGGIPGAAAKFGHCAGCSGITRADIHWKYFQPRLGFAYLVNPKTVIRTGFYITTLTGGAFEFGTAQSASLMGSLLQGEFLRAPNGTNVPSYGSWDTSQLPLPGPAPFGPSIANAGVIFAFPKDKVGTAPYDIAWSVGVQRQLPWDMFLTMSYVGNHANHLPASMHLPNQPPLSSLKYGSLLGELVTSPDAVKAGIKIPYPDFVQQFGGAATVGQALMPFPQFAGYFPVYEMDGIAMYNALQVQAEKRFSSGLSYLADVTISRSDANSMTGSEVFAPNGLNTFNPGPEYAPSAFDQFYDVNFVATYSLPIGPGRMLLKSNNLASKLLGGWQVSGIATYQGGFPMGPSNSQNPSIVNGFNRPDVVPGATIKTFSYSRTKNFLTGKTSSAPVQITTNAFANTGPWQFGNAKRSYASLRTPPLRIENFSVIKTFPIAEGVKAELRFDYFNAFNRTQFQAPDMNSLDSTFGQVTNLSSQISNRQGQATFRIEF